MNRNFFIYANFFLGLIVATGLFQSIFHFLLGPQLYLLQPFANWFLVTSIIYMIGQLFLLKYFYYKKYWITFWSGTLWTIVIFCQTTLVYIILILANRDLEIYNIIIVLLNLTVSLIFALSLIFSGAGERKILKTAGILIFFINLTLGTAFIWGILNQDIQSYYTFEKINQWASFISSFIPILFIRNFKLECKTSKELGSIESKYKSIADLLGYLSIIIVIATLVFGLWLAQDSYSKLRWQKRGPEQAKQLAKKFETHTFVNNNGDSLHYLLMKPLSNDSLTKYPLVVCLHGGPGRIKKKQVKTIQVSHPAPFLTQQVNREKYPAYIFVPQAPQGHSWGGVPSVPDIDTLLVETILSLTEVYNIDEKRLYVAGISGGGFGSWHLIGIWLEMFAAAIPICGAGDPELAHKMVNTAVWAFHGKADRNVPVSASREMIEAIKDAGGNPLYTEFPNVGHNAWPHVIRTQGLMDWLFAQKRD